MKKAIVSILVVCSLLIYGCSNAKKEHVGSFKSAPLPISTVAKVNGVTVSKLNFDLRARAVKSSGNVAMLNPQAVLDLLIEDELLLQTDDTVVSNHDERVALIRKLKNIKRKELEASITITNEDVLAYQKNEELEKVHLQKILLPDQGKADHVQKALKDGADFLELASLFSLEGQPDLGVLELDKLEPQLKSAALELKEGEVSGSFETKEGICIIKKVPLDKKDLKKKALKLKLDEAWQAWIKGLRNQAEIIINSNLFG